MDKESAEDDVTGVVTDPTWVEKQGTSHTASRNRVFRGSHAKVKSLSQVTREQLAKQNDEVGGMESVELKVDSITDSKVTTYDDNIALTLDGVDDKHPRVVYSSEGHTSVLESDANEVQSFAEVKRVLVGLDETARDTGVSQGLFSHQEVRVNVSQVRVTNDSQEASTSRYIDVENKARVEETTNASKGCKNQHDVESTLGEIDSKLADTEMDQSHLESQGVHQLCNQDIRTRSCQESQAVENILLAPAVHVPLCCSIQMDPGMHSDMVEMSVRDMTRAMDGELSVQRSEGRTNSTCKENFEKSEEAGAYTTKGRDTGMVVDEWKKVPEDMWVEEVCHEQVEAEHVAGVEDNADEHHVNVGNKSKHGVKVGPGSDELVCGVHHDQRGEIPCYTVWDKEPPGDQVGQGNIGKEVLGGEIGEMVGKMVKEEGSQGGEADQSHQPCILYSQELISRQNPEIMMVETSFEVKYNQSTVPALLLVNRLPGSDAVQEDQGNSVLVKAEYVGKKKLIVHGVEQESAQLGSCSGTERKTSSTKNYLPEYDDPAEEEFPIRAPADQVAGRNAASGESHEITQGWDIDDELEGPGGKELHAGRDAGVTPGMEEHAQVWNFNPNLVVDPVTLYEGQYSGDEGCHSGIKEVLRVHIHPWSGENQVKINEEVFEKQVLREAFEDQVRVEDDEGLRKPDQGHVLCGDIFKVRVGIEGLEAKVHQQVQDCSKEDTRVEELNAGLDTEEAVCHANLCLKSPTRYHLKWDVERYHHVNTAQQGGVRVDGQVDHREGHRQDEGVHVSNVQGEGTQRQSHDKMMNIQNVKFTSGSALDILNSNMKDYITSPSEWRELLGKSKSWDSGTIFYLPLIWSNRFRSTTASCTIKPGLSKGSYAQWRVMDPAGIKAIGDLTILVNKVTSWGRLLGTSPWTCRAQ